MTKPAKINTVVGSEFMPHAYDNVWDFEKTTGADRLIIAPAADHVDVLIRLTRELPDPFGILYVLLVPRAGHSPGRFECPFACNRNEIESFLTTFRDYFESDGRHHIWLTSFPAASTLVYDQHNVIYAYGLLNRFVQVLTDRGFSRGKVSFPFPHAHHYDVEFDPDEQRVLGYWDWRYSPLQEGDHF